MMRLCKDVSCFFISCHLPFEKYFQRKNEKGLLGFNPYKEHKRTCSLYLISRLVVFRIVIYPVSNFHEAPPEGIHLFTAVVTK